MGKRKALDTIDLQLLRLLQENARRRYSLGRSKLYSLLASGVLPARKLGGRTLIDVAAADAYFAALPAYQAKFSTDS